MKSEIKDEVDTTYPYIGYCGETLVLFTEPRTGVALTGSYRYAKNWAEQNFTKFNGTITLSN